MRSLLFTEPVDFLIGNTYGKYLERDTGDPADPPGLPDLRSPPSPSLIRSGATRVAQRSGEDPRQDLRRDGQERGRWRQRHQLRHHSLKDHHSPSNGHVMSSLTDKIAKRSSTSPAATNTGKSAKERKKGCTKQLHARRRGRRLRLRRRQDRAAADRRCGASGARPDRLRRQLLGQSRRQRPSGPKLYRTGFTTDISELDVVYGGEKRLFKAISEIIEKYDPPAVFVYQTCVTGADRRRHRGGVQARRPRSSASRCIPVNAPGFVGPKNLGNKLAGEALLDHVIGTEEPEFTTPYDINIIGEYNLSRRAVAGEAAARRARHPHPVAASSGDAPLPRGRLGAPRPRQHDGVLQVDDQRRPQDGGALRHPVLRRLVLRHHRH